MSLPAQRRIHPRYPIQKIASYHYDGRQFLTRTLDLGLGGMKIDTPDCLPRDEYLNFKLLLGPNSIWLKGRIAYSGVHSGNRSLSGVQFVELSSEAYVSLQKCLAFQEEWPKSRGMRSVDGRKGARPDSIKTGGEY